MRGKILQTSRAATLASEKTLDMAKLTPKDIDVADLHDSFTILEIAEGEHMGYFKKGESLLIHTLFNIL